MSHVPYNRLAVRTVAFIALLLCLDAGVDAATYTWDPSGGGNSGGHGNWDLADSFWYNGNTDVAWPNTGSDTAVFAGSGDFVSITSAIQVNTLTFNSPYYYLAGGTGGGLTLTGNSPTINGTAAAFLTANLAGTTGLVINSGAVISLSGNNTYTGGTTLTAGVLSAASAQALGSGTISFNGGTLQYAGSNVTDYSARFSTAANQAYNVNTNTANVTFASGLGSNGGILTKLGAGTLTLTGNNTYTGGTNFTGGAVNVGSASALGSTGTLSFSGGSLQYSAANTTDYSARFSTAANQAYAVDTNSQNVTFATALTSSGGTLTKSGAGTLTLTGNNTYTGGTNFLGGALNVGSLGALGSTGTFLFQGGALQYSTANTTDYSSRFGTADYQNFQVDTNGQNITFATGLVSSNGVLTKLGAGTLILSGNSTLTFSSYAMVSAGTLAMTPAGSLNTGSLYVGGGATFNFNGGTVTNNFVKVGLGSSATAAMVNLASGALNGQQIEIGDTAGSAAVFNQSGGTASGSLAVGRITGSTGTYNLSGGTLTTAPYIGYDGTGIFNQTGGTLNGTQMILGLETGSIGTYAISGASNFTEAYYIDVGIQGAGTFTMNGGTVIDSNNLSFGLGLQDGSSGTVNLNGGTLTVGSVNGGSGNSTFNFNGGTLRAGMNSTSFFQGITTANVQVGGAKIDTNGFNVTFAQSLLHDTTTGAPVTDGGLTKLGTGTLTLGGVNTYRGGTTVSVGMLTVASNGALGTGNVSVAAGSTLSLSSGVTAAHNASTGTTLTLASASTSIVNLAGTGVQDTVGILIVNGMIEPSGTYGAAGSGAMHTNIADFTGTGELLVVIPEPSTRLMVGAILGLALIIDRRRRGTA